MTDTHRERAAKMFNVPLEEVTDDQRQEAKRRYYFQNYGGNLKNFIHQLNAVPSGNPLETSPPPETKMEQSHFQFDEPSEEPTRPAIRPADEEFDAAHEGKVGEPNLPELDPPDEEDDPR